MADDAQPRGTSIHPQDVHPSQKQDQTVKQVTRLVKHCYIRQTRTECHRCTTCNQDDQVTEETPVIKFNERFAHIIVIQLLKLRWITRPMCNPTIETTIHLSNGLQSINPMTCSLLNCADIIEKIATVEAAKD
jgi:hypothetical protein